MGRAIAREPRAFLMDEPLSNLDAKLRVGMRASLAELHARLGVTTIYVTHDQTEAMTLGQRVAVMRDGTVVQVDAPQVLYASPRNVFVAAFIGSPSMNLVEAVIEDGAVRFGDHVVPLDPDRRPSRRGRRRARHPARRPSRTATSQDRTCRGSACMSTSSRSSARTRTPASACARRAPRSTRVTRARTHRSSPPRPFCSPRASIRVRGVRQGADAELAVDPARFHFFDVETGEALVGDSVVALEPAAVDTVPATATRWS